MILIRYLMVGVANTLVGLGTIYFAMYFLHFNVVQSNAIGYSIGILLSFSLNKTWTFSSQDHITSSFIRYLLVLGIGYAANLATVLYIYSHFYLSPYVAQAIGILPYTAIGFLGSRYFAFRTQGRSSAAENKLSNKAVFDKKSVTPCMVDVSIVVPCYNEEAVLAETTKRLADLLQQLIIEGRITPSSRVYYVDDGSRDISVDVDLQDDLSEIKEMIEYYTA